MSALLSMTMRSLVKELRQLASRQTTRRGPAGQAGAESLELVYVQLPTPVLLLPGEKHGNLELRTSDDIRLALRCLQKRRRCWTSVANTKPVVPILDRMANRGTALNVHRAIERWRFVIGH